MKKILFCIVVCGILIGFGLPQFAEASDDGTNTSQVDTSSQVEKNILMQGKIEGMLRQLIKR